jgi:hypothetical protein
MRKQFSYRSEKEWRANVKKLDGKIKTSKTKTRTRLIAIVQGFIIGYFHSDAGGELEQQPDKVIREHKRIARENAERYL